MAVELDTTGNGAIDIEKGGTNATSAVQALSNLGGQPFDADLTTLSSGTYAQKRALIEAFAKPVLGVDALRTTMADFDGDCRYLAYHTASGDGGHGTFIWSTADLSAEVTADPLHGIYVAPTSDPTGASGAWVRQSGLLTENITVTVGTSGHFATINAAIEFLSTFQPDYRNTGVTATVHLLAGFVMAEQVLVRGTDLGWITITGADAETVITHTALTVNFSAADYGVTSYPAFGVSKGGTLPRIGQLFRFNVANVGGNKNGVMAIGPGSSADIRANSGVKDTGTYGIYASYGSTINAYSADASGAGTYGIYATQSSTINAATANASGAGNTGIYAAQCSTINAATANASGAGTYGIYATQSSTINAATANASGAGNTGIYATQCSTINAYSADASGAGNTGILVAYGSTINAATANASGAGSYGIFVAYGSTINAPSATGTLSQAANTLTSSGIIFQ